MSDKASIVALGNAVLDLEFRGGASLLHKTRLRLNDTVLASHQEQTQRRYVLETALGQPTPMSGGSAANSLTLAAAMGVDCALMSRLGDDPEAEHYRQDLQQAGVQLLAPEKGSGRTANCLAVITPDGERTMSTELGCCAELDSKALHPKVIADSDWLLLEGYCLSSEAGRKTVFEAQQIALEAGTKIALTLSSALLAKSQRDTISQLADAGLNLIIGNQSEAQAVTHSRDARKSLETLARQAPMVAITLSGEGALCNFNGEIWVAPTAVVQVEDSLGAGDAFAGALLGGLALGRDAHTAVHWGCLAGTAQVQCRGPRLHPGLRGKLLQVFAS